MCPYWSGHGCTLTIGAAGCTLTVGTVGRGLVGAAGCALTVGQPGAAWSGQGVCSGFALAARRLLPPTLRALTDRATRSRFRLRPHQN